MDIRDGVDMHCYYNVYVAIRHFNCLHVHTMCCVIHYKPMNQVMVHPTTHNRNQPPVKHTIYGSYIE